MHRTIEMARADVAAAETQTEKSADAPNVPEPADPQPDAPPQTDAPAEPTAPTPVGVGVPDEAQGAAPPNTDAPPQTAAPPPAKPKSTAWRDIRAFFLNLGLTIAAVWAIFTFVFGVYIMSGEGMYPRVCDGDLVLFYRMSQEYYIDDVLTFTVDDTRYTARYVAMAGDVVNITESGQLMINGNIQTEEIFYATYTLESDIEYPYTVPDGCVFLLGDYRTSTVDSRIYGAVDIDDLDGKIITIVRRRSV